MSLTNQIISGCFKENNFLKENMKVCDYVVSDFKFYKNT